MPNNNFPHLPLVSLQRGAALLTGFNKPDPRVVQNKEPAHRLTHSANLLQKAKKLTQYWVNLQQERQARGLPAIKGGIPFLLKVPEQHDNLLFALGEKFGVEIVAEFKDGFILVASEDVDLVALQKMITDFANEKHGSATAAEILEICDDGSEKTRLDEILVGPLKKKWPLDEKELWILDISIQTASTIQLGNPPEPYKKESVGEFEKRQKEWELIRDGVYKKWDEVQLQREAELAKVVKFYAGMILRITQDGGQNGVVKLPDSISCRVQMSGLGFNDLIQNCPHVFEISIPEDIEQPVGQHFPAEAPGPQSINPPSEGVATICVIDSGIQEGHRLLAPAIDSHSSRCFLPGEQPNDTTDKVFPNGHGTCVAGAILYPHGITQLTHYQLPFFIQNARILDDEAGLPGAVFPPDALRSVVMHYRHGARGTRIFNHSIAANGAFSVQRMSSWAAEIDFLSHTQDVLIIQAAGNVDGSNEKPSELGIAQHLQAGRNYPEYLLEETSRIANPAQSLQAITVGSIAITEFNDGNRYSIASASRPSAFTRTGFGMWDSIKPEVVEFGGDYVRDDNQPPNLTKVPEVCPELIRSTLTQPGGAFGRVEVGTSFATPRVTAIAGALNTLFPHHPTLLFRALIIQSARWPEWAENAPEEERVSILRFIGYGVPDLGRATENSETRVTLITDGIQRIHAREAAIYAVEIPQELRRPGSDFDIRVDITLSYSAEPRRSRSSRRGYMAVWLDWLSSNKGENLESFKARALKDQEGSKRHDGAIRWMLGNKKEKSGQVDGASRQNGTVQKDWAIIKSFELPEYFAIAVRGHQGWSTDPSSEASFALAITIEVLGQNIPVYNLVRERINVEVESEERIVTTLNRYIDA